MSTKTVKAKRSTTTSFCSNCGQERVVRTFGEHSHLDPFQCIQYLRKRVDGQTHLQAQITNLQTQINDLLVTAVGYNGLGLP